MASSEGSSLSLSGLKRNPIDNYECYEEFDWEVQWQKKGDSLARYLVRVGEIIESIKIIQQALEGTPDGSYENLEIYSFDREKESEWNDFELIDQPIKLTGCMGQVKRLFKVCILELFNE
ncbi:hypothetical protein Fmac_014240 [Flemingia macrophylla]|uniref:NADH-quinone oxidoreductase subunit D domain-containing protein n=1 Tax=Flemingia macrophylla TaxID=520843 RepID=A0ABD1MB43_9FABA